MKEAAIILSAYLVGSVPMTYILGRMVKHIDIRRYGSGNVGASNAWVHLGKLVVAPVAVFDLLAKGSLSVYLAQQLSGGPWIPVFAGLAAIAGHNWSVYLKFTGGRGITVVLGVLLLLALKELAAASLVVIAGWIVFRNSALWGGNRSSDASNMERRVQGVRAHHRSMYLPGRLAGDQKACVQQRPPCPWRRRLENIPASSALRQRRFQQGRVGTQSAC